MLVIQMKFNFEISKMYRVTLRSTFEGKPIYYEGVVVAISDATVTIFDVKKKNVEICQDDIVAKTEIGS